MSRLIASVLHLSRRDVKALGIRDPYALHRVVYGLYEDVRSSAEKNTSTPSGIVYADEGGNSYTRKILMLADRKPAFTAEGGYGEVQSKVIPEGFLEHDYYQFKVVINPTRRDRNSGKLVPVKGRTAIAEWFCQKALKSWGFLPDSKHLQVDKVQVLRFYAKNKRPVTLAQANIKGVLTVKNRDLFCKSFANGIGRGRAFGCGLLQLVPIQANPFV